MPLTARLRDEENERINNILKRLIGMDYVPENGNTFIDEVLSGIGLSLQQLLEMQPENLIAHLEQYRFDWENAEQFADFLTMLSTRLPDNGFSLKEKAVKIYRYIQTGSKTFSWSIQNKITAVSKTDEDAI